MSDRVVELHRDRNEVGEKSMQPYQRTWMAHWMRSSCGPTSAAQDQLSIRCESGEESRCTKNQPVVMGKECREASKGKMIDIVDESLAISSGKQRDDAFEGTASVMFKLPRNRENIGAVEKGESSRSRQDLPRPQVDPHFGNGHSLGGIQNGSSSMLALAPSEAEIQSRDFRLQPGGISLTPKLQVKADKLIEKNKLAVSPYFRDGNLDLTSKIVAYQANSTRTPMHPFLSHDSKNPSGATVVAHQKKLDTSAAFLVHDHSMDADQLRYFIDKPFQTMPKQPDVELFSSWIDPPDTGNLKIPHHGSYASTRVPSSVHDVERMGICTTIDTVEEYLKVPQKFSQTTRQFFFTRKTGVNLFDVGQMFRESIYASDGKKVNEFPCLSPDFTFHIKRGSKFQPLGSFIESARKEDAVHVKTSTFDLRNESSAETDTLDMDAFSKNHLFGVGSPLSNKDSKGGQSPLTIDAAVASTRQEIRGKHVSTEIPDINQELPAFPGLTSSANDVETSTSRTQSLDVEHFLTHAEHPTNLESRACSDDPLGSDPCSRWVKRLKSSVSSSLAYGTKNLRMEESSSHEKVNNKLFRKILKCTKTTSEHKMSESSDKDQVAVDSTTEELKKAESSSVEPAKKNEDVKHLHTWIQRWCHNPAASPKQKSETIFYKPHKSKSILDFQKKQLPSVAAMALMGKVMTGFCPREFRKRGSSVVWNTERN